MTRARCEKFFHILLSKKFGWVADKYGVSWQLNLERS
ncbi:MAG: VOC family protein [Ktedonobacteraceae bacterium]|nr:VOC family protein [Ktedonobacteraceae bacterium]